MSITYAINLMTFEYNDFNDQGTFSLINLKNQLLDPVTKPNDQYKIIWTMDDELSLGIDGYRIQLKKHHLLFCTPLNQIELGPQQKDVAIYCFNREFYCIRDHDKEVSCNGFLFLGSSVPVIVGLDDEEQQSFHLLYQFLVEEFKVKDHIQGEMLRVLLKRLLIKSVRIARRTMPVPDMPQSKLDTIRQFNLLVEMHFKDKHKVAAYAQLLHTTPKSLSNLFSRYHHKSPLMVIGERIALEAKRLLQFSDKNTNEIAFELGFKEASHFSKFFKKHTGKSPRAFKANLR